nr:hypothetical protein [Tanacetum cinerariifolium]
MGIPKKPNVGPVTTFDYSSTRLYGKGSSDKYGKPTGAEHTHTHVRKAIDDMHTTPASSTVGNTPPSLHTHLANHQQIKDVIHTSQTYRPQRLTFVTYNERACNDTNS